MSSGHKAIGVLAPQLSGDYFGTLFAGIHAVTRRHDPRLIAIQGSPRHIFGAQLAIAQVDGWIVINNADGIELIANSGVPIVTIGAQAPGYPAVFPDNYAGMRAAVAHLIDHRHQRIAFIGDLANHDIEGSRRAAKRGADSAAHCPYLFSRKEDLPLLAPHLWHRRALLWLVGVCALRFSSTIDGVARDAPSRPCHGR